jgi:hypothetical protein
LSDRRTALTAFLDAKALYPAELRNLLMRLALAEAYRPLWSDRVQKEWTEALARDRPDLPREKIERVCTLMEHHIPEATVEDYEPWSPSSPFPMMATAMFSPRPSRATQKSW